MLTPSIRHFVLSLLILLAYSSVSIAQWIQTPYNFYPNPGINNNGYTRYEDGSHVNIGKIVSSASNGYGTWAVDDSARWYLFGNNLASENHGSTKIPSGIIAQGLLPATAHNGYSYHSNEVRVVCNTKGSVRFVAPGHGIAGSRRYFAVFGFDEGLGGNEHHLSLSFNGLPKTAPSNDIEQSLVFIKDQISTNSLHINKYPVIETDTNQIQFPVWDGEADYRDEFDVAMDGKYLYVGWVWAETHDTSTIPRVLTTVVELGTGLCPDTLVWPKIFPEDYQLRPTVACDVRRVPSLPTFEFANMNQGVMGTLVFLRTFNGTLWSSELLSRRFRWYPEDDNATPPDTVTQNEAGFTRARVVVGSASGATAPRKVVYAIGHISGNAGALFIYDRLHLASGKWRNRPRVVQDDYHAPPVATYSFGIPAQHSPIYNQDDFKVYNNHIVAFANPYDGQGNSSYNEFHCVVQLAPSDVGVTATPLMICRTLDNGIWPADHLDSRTIISREYLSSSWSFTAFPTPGAGVYTASANQGGIHVFWKDQNSNALLYNRDQRKFDENVEENTVVSYGQFVGNNPQTGDPGRILPEKKVVLWSDPHFAVTDTTQGIYVREPASHFGSPIASGSLVFPTSGDAEFHIGNDNSTDSGAMLLVFPNSHIQFAYSSGDDQRLIVNQASTVDWYGTVNSTYNSAQIQPWNVNTYGFGTIQFIGDSAVMSDTSHGYPSSLIRPANLVVHGGSILGIGGGIVFEATNSLLDFKYEKHIEPVFGLDTNNKTVSGQLLVRGKADLTNSIIKGHNNNASFLSPAAIMTIRPAPSSAEPPDDQFTATNCKFINDASNRSQIAFEGDLGDIDTVTAYYRDILISGGLYDGIEILAMDPLDTHSFTIEDATFVNLKKKAIHFKRTEGLDYDHIIIRDNAFINTLLTNSDWVYDVPHI